MLIGQTTTTLAFAFASGHRMIDFAAFAALALVWIFIGLLLYIEYRIIRARAEGRGPGGSPGL